MVRNRIAPVLGLLLVSACASAPPPPPPPPPKQVDPPPPPPPAPEGRWIARDREMAVGPSLGGGTLALLGGRRVLIKPDGSVEADTSGKSPLLRGLASVPTEKGNVVIGFDQNTLYRVKSATEPLTELASTNYISTVLTAPGKLVVKTGSSDLAIDVETGAHSVFESNTPFAASQMRFLDMNRGAAVFEHAGMHVTSDGGKTWTKATLPGNRQGAWLTLHTHGAEVLARGYERGSELQVDFASGNLTPFQEKDDEHPVPRWIRLAETDVAHAAAQSGMLLDDKTVAVVSGRAVALVDLTTLLPTRVWPLETALSGCAPTHMNKDGTAELVCLDSEKGSARLHIPVKDPKGKVALKQLGNPGAYVSTSGAVLGFGACESKPDEDAPPVDEYSQVCVWDADNKGHNVKLGGTPDGPMSVTDAGPLAGGGAAVVAFGEGKAVEVRFPGTKRPPVKLSLTGYGRVNNFVDEDVDGTLRFVLKFGEDRKGVELSPSGAVQVIDLPEKVRMYRRFAFQFLYESNEMTMSRDFGKTWLSLGKGLPDSIGRPDYFTSDVGVAAGQYVFLGTTVPPAPEPLPEPKGKRIAHADSVFDITCATDPKWKAPAKPPAKPPATIADLLKGPPAAKGTFANVKSSWAQVGTFASIAFSGKEGTPANKWTMRWISTHDFGTAKVHEASAVPPKDKREPWDVGHALSEGDRLFAMLSGRDPILARVDGSKLSFATAPSSYVSRSVIGYGNGKPIFFEANQALWVWYEGKEPEKLSALHDSFLLGADPKGGLSLLTFRGLLAPRAYLTAPLPKPGSGALMFDTDPSFSFAKWAMVPADNVPFCDAKAKGTRYRVSVYPRLHVDGKQRSAPGLADVILRSVGGPCISTLEVGSYQRDFWLQADFAKKKTIAGDAPAPVGLPSQYQCTVNYGPPPEVH